MAHPLVAASVIHSSGWLSTRKDPLFSQVNREAADKAYHMAGIGPKDLDFAEIHDAFSGEEVAAYEPMRFCPEGECIQYVRDKHFDLKGKFPINPSGGLLSLGHPLGASGLRGIPFPEACGGSGGDWVGYHLCLEEFMPIFP